MGKLACSASHSRRSAKTHSERLPGWPEIVVGLAALYIAALFGARAIAELGLKPVLTGLMVGDLSGFAGLAGFAAAVSLQLRSWRLAGVRGVSRRWLWLGASFGLLAFHLKGALLISLTQIFGAAEDVQSIYATGASSGLWSAVLSVLSLVC